MHFAHAFFILKQEQHFIFALLMFETPWPALRGKTTREACSSNRKPLPPSV